LIKKAIHRQQKIIIIVLVLVILSLTLAVFGVIYSGQLAKWGKIAPPSGEPTPSQEVEEVASPSAYATDSGLLKIKADLKEIQKELDETELYEAGLLPPVLDMEVELEE